MPVLIQEMPKEDALKLGAMALFGEKYGDVVRVVAMDKNFSVELCGGTHVASTGMIGLFIITAESAIAASVRRIEALTGAAALRYVNQKINQNKHITELLKNADPIKVVEKLIADKLALEKKVELLETRELTAIRNSLLQKSETINAVKFIGAIVVTNAPDALKKLCGELKNQLSADDKNADFVIALCANIGGKSSVAIALAESTAAKGLDAVQIIKNQIAPLIKGGGGGQKTLATAGGQDTSQLDQVIQTIKELL